MVQSYAFYRKQGLLQYYFVRKYFRKKVSCSVFVWQYSSIDYSKALISNVFTKPFISYREIGHTLSVMFVFKRRFDTVNNDDL